MTKFEVVVAFLNEQPIGYTFTRKDLRPIVFEIRNIIHITNALQSRGDIEIVDKRGNWNVYQTKRQIEYSPEYGRMLSETDGRRSKRKGREARKYPLTISVDKAVYDYFHSIDNRSEVGNRMLRDASNMVIRATGQKKYPLSFSVDYEVWNKFKGLANRSVVANWILKRSIEKEGSSVPS